MSADAEIRRRLAALDPQRMELEDDSARHRGHAGAREGMATHWNLLVVSPRFAGQSRLARQRMVYAALGELMQTSIHALALTTLAPGEPGA